MLKYFAFSLTCLLLVLCTFDNFHQVAADSDSDNTTKTTRTTTTSTTEPTTKGSELTAMFGINDLASDQQFLEDYYSTENDKQTHEQDQMELAFTFPNETDGKSTTDYYTQAIKNLKEKSKKVEKMRLRGGYVYLPKENETDDDNALKNEINAIVQHLKTLDKVVNANGIRLRRLIFTAALAVDAKPDTLNITELLKSAYPNDEIKNLHENEWAVPFNIEHGRGVLKLRISKDEQHDTRPVGRSRYFPVNTMRGRMGPGPMVGSASYDKEKNVTRIYSISKGHIELDGNHMDSEELDEYLPRNFDDE